MGQGSALLDFETIFVQTLQVLGNVSSDAGVREWLKVIFLSLLGCLFRQRELKDRDSIFAGGIELKGKISSLHALQDQFLRSILVQAVLERPPQGI